MCLTQPEIPLACGAALGEALADVGIGSRGAEGGNIPPFPSPPAPASVLLFTVDKLNNAQAPKFILSFSIHHLLSGTAT